MSFTRGQAPDEELLERYLLGSLPDEESERLDELSVADDGFAISLSAVEHDLVDAYVRGELSGETLERFRSRYLSSPTGRNKVRFAETLIGYQKRPSTVGSQVLPIRRTFASTGLVRWAAWATAAAVILAATGYLLVEDRRLRSEMIASRAAFEERAQLLQRQLEEQRAADAENVKDLARVRQSLAELEARQSVRSQGVKPVVATFLLTPATRGVGDLAAIVIPPGTYTVTLRLELEADEFPRYGAELRAAASDGVLWRIAELEAKSTGAMKTVDVTLPAALLKPRSYVLELTGSRGSAGSGTFAGSYPFRVVLR